MAGKKFPLDKFPELLKNPPHDVDIMLYDKKKKGFHLGDNHVKKSRTNRLEESINNLAKEMRAGFKQVNNRIDNLEKDVNSLKQDVKNINIRLDRVERRLDYNSLQIEEIQKRLDYNGLKKLGTNR